MKHTYSLSFLAALALTAGTATAQSVLYEGFDNVAGLLSSGWINTNNSAPMGPDNWSQGQLLVGAIAYSGDSSSYLENYYTATDPNGTGTISDWFISPAVMLNDGDSISLYAISFNSANFPDRVEVRISPNGGSDVGVDETTVGDFTTLVFAINPNLDNTSFPSVQGAGDTWTRFAGEVTGLGGMTSCRVAVRYWVTDAGGLGANSSTIAIDDLDVFSGTSSASISEHAGFTYSVAPNPVTDRVTVSTEQGLAVDATLFATSGQRVRGERVVGQVTWDLRDLEAGVYLLELRDPETDRVVRERIVKQ